MATINPVLTRINENTVEFLYSALTTTNDRGAGIPEAFMDYADRSVQVLGTFGAGGNLRVEGSNDGGTTYGALTDPQGNALNFTAAKVEAVTEITLLTRPFISAGDGTTDLDCAITCRRSRSGRQV